MNEHCVGDLNIISATDNGIGITVWYFKCVKEEIIYPSFKSTK